MLYWNPRTNLIVCFVSIVCAGRHLVLGTGSWDYWLDLTIGRLKQMLHPEEVGGGSMARTEHKVCLLVVNFPKSWLDTIKIQWWWLNVLPLSSCKNDCLGHGHQIELHVPSVDFVYPVDSPPQVVTWPNADLLNHWDLLQSVSCSPELPWCRDARPLLYLLP